MLARFLPRRKTKKSVLGFVDLSHAAFADLLQDFVMRDRLAEHENPPHCAVQLRSMLRGEGVNGNRQAHLMQPATVKKWHAGFVSTGGDSQEAEG